MRIREPLALIALSFAAAAQADCLMPPGSVEIPDGATASLEQMVEARDAAMAHIGALEDYIECLDAQNQQLGDDAAAAEQRALNITRHNAAVESIQATAESYNRESRAFNAANTDD
ncbi:MAG: hypothetical protein JJT85_08445 [Chromatiales bacterium]|nr:hypothetical protein [Chromatiales bacterium]